MRGVLHSFLIWVTRIGRSAATDPVTQVISIVKRSDGSRRRSYLSVSRIIVGVLGTAIVAMYAVGSRRLVATDSQWYRSLVKPAWQPPRIVIGLIWPYNFAMLTTATWVVACRLSNTQHLVWLTSLTLSVLAALAWAWLFFNRHRLFASGVALVFATLFAIPLLVISLSASPVLGFAFVPYQLWLVLATSIAFGFSAQ